MYSKIFIIEPAALPPAFSALYTIKAVDNHRFSYLWSGRIRVYKNKPRAIRINTRIHADLSSFDDKSSERFEPQQTAVCRLNPHASQKKLKPPHLRRFEFSGRDSNTAPLWHIQNRLKHIRFARKNREKQGFFAKNGHSDQKTHNLH